MFTIPCEPSPRPHELPGRVGSSSTGGGTPVGLNSTAVDTDDYHSLYYVAYYNIEMSVALSLLELIGTCGFRLASRVIG